jgi:very-short-patch-repair endonuclease
MQLPRNIKNLQNAKNLRKNMTRYEKHLWYDFLRDYPIRFRRQEVIGNYIADFYCDKAKLIIELDGSQHYENKGIKKDKERTKYFESFEIEVIRFSNAEVFYRFDDVCNYINLIVQRRIKYLSDNKDNS